MSAKGDIGFQEAYALTIKNIEPLGKEILPVSRLVGRILAEDLFAKIDSPLEDSSIKDGYAVISSDIEGASRKSPRKLILLGSVVAGKSGGLDLTSGYAIRITAGSLLPRGAEAVVSQEFTREHEGMVEVFADAEQGRNVLRKGDDVKARSKLIDEGHRLRPNEIGLIAASGHSHAWVYKRPRVAVIATGSEVVAPGRKLKPGKIFASNLVNINCWLTSLGMNVKTKVVKDDPVAIRAAIKGYLRDIDAMITIGGAWKSEMDIVVRMFDEMGWSKLYHRVRMGPGKAVGFGLLDSKHIFCLPGGPPSNEMAFLQLALPGLWKLSGARNSLLPTIRVLLTKTISGQIDWAQFIHGRLRKEGGNLLIEPVSMRHRLQGMANTSCILSIPEGCEKVHEGAVVDVQLLNTDDLLDPLII